VTNRFRTETRDAQIRDAQFIKPVRQRGMSLDVRDLLFCGLLCGRLFA
jgi:hypothetical protein